MPWRLVASGKFGALAIGAGAAVLVGTHWWAYSAGVDRERERAQAEVLDYQTRALEASARLRALERERQTEQREALREIRDADDPTGCADERPPDAILERVR